MDEVTSEGHDNAKGKMDQPTWPSAGDHRPPQQERRPLLLAVPGWWPALAPLPSSSPALDEESEVQITSEALAWCFLCLLAAELMGTWRLCPVSALTPHPLCLLSYLTLNKRVWMADLKR